MKTTETTLPESAGRIAIHCLKCGDTIRSMHRHDFRWCTCKTVAIDGGSDYLRVCAKDDYLYELIREDGTVLPPVSAAWLSMEDEPPQQESTKMPKNTAPVCVHCGSSSGSLFVFKPGAGITHQDCHLRALQKIGS